MPQLGADTPAPFQKPRKPSKGEIEVDDGSFLLWLFRLLKVPMPKDSDEADVERVGVLLARRFPILTKWRVK